MVTMSTQRSHIRFPQPAVLSFTLCVFREAMGVVLHKDSKWYQQWKDFKDNNVVFNSKNHLTSSFSLTADCCGTPVAFLPIETRQRAVLCS